MSCGFPQTGENLHNLRCVVGLYFFGAELGILYLFFETRNFLLDRNEDYFLPYISSFVLQ